MQCKENTQIFFFLIAAVFVSVLLVVHSLVFAQAASSPDSITITGAVPGCGDGVIQPEESCDGSNLNNQTCSTLGFSGGVLSCNLNCTFNTSQCTVGVGGFVQPVPPPAPPPPRRPEPEKILPTGDCNADGLINFVDLSIMLYWFGKTGEGANCSDLNGDGRINFVDVSILLYRWKDAV
jgi:hypothetical protein